MELRCRGEQLETEMATLYTNVAREALGETGVGRLQEVGYRAVVVAASDDLVRNVRSQGRYLMCRKPAKGRGFPLR
jgi:hypothetical protein